MADKGIELTFTANAKQLLRSTDDVEKAFEEVSDSLDNIATDSAKATNTLAKNFDKAGDKVERTAEDLERSFKEVADTVGTTSATAGNKLASNTRKGVDKAKSDIGELGAEARQNLAETVSSFDGSVQSFANGLQGTLGGIVSSLGPAWAAVGVSGAIGIGLILSEIEKGNERSVAWREEVAALADEYIETGTIGTRSVGRIAEKMRELATETDEAKTDLKDLARTADGAGSSFEDLANAYAGSREDLSRLIKEGKDYADQLQEQTEGLDMSTDAGNRLYGELIKASSAQEKYNAYLADAKAKADAAAESAELYARAGGPELEARAELLATVNEGYDQTASALSDYTKKETGLLDTAKYIAAMEARSKALADYQANLAAADLSPEAKAFLNEQGADAAASFLAGYQKATPAQKEALNKIWTEAAREDSGAYRETIGKAFGGPALKGPKVEPPEIDVLAPLRKAQKELDRNPLKMTVIQTDRFGKPIK